jgi:hypothetical protein
MRPRVCLFASAVLMLLINAAPLPAATAESVNLASVDTCSLLTQAEVSAAVGVSMSSGGPLTPKSSRLCMWFPSGGLKTGASPPIIMGLTLWVLPAENFEQNMVGQNVTLVSGLGDEAYYVDLPGRYTVLDVEKGTICVQVGWQGFAGRQAIMDAERSIAAQVLSEL